MDHKDEGFPGFYSALGGKYTTSRLLAEKLVDRIAEFLPNHFSECKTEVTPILGGNFSDFKALENELQKEFPTISGEKIEILVHRYGSEARTILKDYPNEKEVFVLQNGEHIYSDEIAHIASKEDIQFASDFYFRRSGVGVPGKPDTANNEKILSKLGQYLGWDNKRLADEKNCIDTRYKINI
jgi:glycerol-3-phosphate dehydrogenase